MNHPNPTPRGMLGKRCVPIRQSVTTNRRTRRSTAPGRRTSIKVASHLEGLIRP